MFLDYILWLTQMAGLFQGGEGAEGGISALKPMYCNESDFVCLKLIKAIASGWPRANKRQNASSCIDLAPPPSPKQHRRVLRELGQLLWPLSVFCGYCALFLGGTTLSLIPLTACLLSLYLFGMYVLVWKGVCRSFSLDWAISNWALSKRPQADG